jgi:hypothetical protein
MKTRRFWEKTRETPDQSIVPAGRVLLDRSPFGMNEDPGHSLFSLPTSHHDDARSGKGWISPKSLHGEVSIVQITPLVRPLRSHHPS